jgi:dTDP-4-dehydrorhamnose 3,5-epimerase
MKFSDLKLSGVRLFHPTVYHDERGFFYESYRKSMFADHGIHCDFVQDNHSYSKQGTLRGMHFQKVPGQAKLISVAVGAIYDVFVDVRQDSSTYGQWESILLEAHKKQLLFLPPGFAHGFYVVSDEAYVIYKVSSFYQADTEMTFRYDDPELKIIWPGIPKIISARDQMAATFREVCG